MSISKSLKKQNPFGVVALTWFGLLCLVSFTAENFFLSLFWGFVFWTASVLNLFCLSKCVKSIFDWFTDQNKAKVLKIFLWGALKLTVLALFGFLIFVAQSRIGTTALLGIMTTFVVPVLGGIYFSQLGERINYV